MMNQLINGESSTYKRRGSFIRCFLRTEIVSVFKSEGAGFGFQRAHSIVPSTQLLVWFGLASRKTGLRSKIGPQSNFLRDPY
jgi:hypothetical protein